MALYELNGVQPVLGRDVFVADSAAVIGDVHLGDEAGVWFSAVLRGRLLSDPHRRAHERAGRRRRPHHGRSRRDHWWATA